MDGAKKPYKEPLFAALCYDPRMTNPALKILLALIALALTTDAALAHDLRLARQCRRSCPRPRRIRPQLTGTWSLARTRDQGRLLVDEIIAVKAQKVGWVK